MPIFLAAFLGGLASAAASLTGRVLIALGIGYVSYTGISAGLGTLEAQVIANLQALPSQWITVAHLLQLDKVVSIFFSAVAARLVLAGLTSGTLTRMVIK